MKLASGQKQSGSNGFVLNSLMGWSDVCLSHATFALRSSREIGEYNVGRQLRM